MAGLARELMTKRRAEIQVYGVRLVGSVGVPPLNLDSVVWVLGGLLINSSFNMNKAINGGKGPKHLQWEGSRITSLTWWALYR